MATDESRTTTAAANGASERFIDRVEDRLWSRRSFLAGLGLGGAAGAGAAIGLTRVGGGFQSFATLAGGAALPSSTRYYLPAVVGGADGVVIGTTFSFEPGGGELYVDLGGVEVRHDLQLALRESMRTAAALTGGSFAETATHVAFDPPETGVLALRGKSWEAGLTVALVGALTERDLSRDTLVTGVVGQDGALLPVGGVESKAAAARAFGADTLLVPPDQAASVPGIDVEPVPTIAAVERRVFED